MQRPEYGSLHLGFLIFRAISIISRCMDILFMCSKRKIICLEIFPLGVVGMNWLQQFYLAGFVVVTIDLVVVRDFFTRTTFRTERILR